MRRLIRAAVAVLKLFSATSSEHRVILLESERVIAAQVDFERFLFPLQIAKIIFGVHAVQEDDRHSFSDTCFLDNENSILAPARIRFVVTELPNPRDILLR